MISIPTLLPNLPRIHVSTGKINSSRRRPVVAAAAAAAAAVGPVPCASAQASGLANHEKAAQSSSGLRQAVWKSGQVTIAAVNLRLRDDNKAIASARRPKAYSQRRRSACSILLTSMNNIRIEDQDADGGLSLTRATSTQTLIQVQMIERESPLWSLFAREKCGQAHKLRICNAKL